MTINDIIKSVRWCIDEEAVDPTHLDGASAYDFDSTTTDTGLMNNIIKDKIGDALRWVCLYSPADLLIGSDETENDEEVSTGILVDIENPTVSPVTGQKAGRIVLPENFIRLARVRVDGWHRAVCNPISEDSEEYLQLYDENGATATYDRPKAALIDKAVRELEVWPWNMGSVTPPIVLQDNVEITYIANTNPVAIEETVQGETTVVGYALPPKAKTSFIYYLAFLLLSAYNDTRATRMLDIAKMNLGKATNEND